MQDLEEIGLIYAPHTSAGRLPTELGLRFFVDALLELGDISRDEREQIEAQVKAASQEQTLEALLGDAMIMLSGLTRSAGVVVTTKENARLKHVEFVRIEPERALAVLVDEDGSVENRILQIPAGLPPSALCEAGNYLNAPYQGPNFAGGQGRYRGLAQVGGGGAWRIDGTPCGCRAGKLGGIGRAWLAVDREGASQSAPRPNRD